MLLRLWSAPEALAEPEGTCCWAAKTSSQRSNLVCLPGGLAHNLKRKSLLRLLGAAVERGNQQNGFLQLEDIYNLNLSADLVVLSACETGLGKQIQGEGLIGLTRGFMYAGASRVMASLWKVDDVATADLMGRFYRAMEKDGMSPAAALRQAQIEMLKQQDWGSPYYWAAFQMQGEWK